MSNASPHLRALTFAGVLILVSGLMIGLFQEAQAVSIEVADPSPAVPRTNTPSATFQVTVEIPQNERLPIQSSQVLIERTSGTTKTNPTLIADALCATTGGGNCPGAAPITENTGSGIVTSIELTSSSPTLAGYGYGPCGGYCFVTNTGYGYQAGSGYGYEVGGGGTGYEITDTTGGYGYDSGTLDLTYQITINPSQLGAAGNYWLTFNLNTGSSVLGDVQSPAKAFTVARGGGGGGIVGGGGGGDVTAPPTPPSRQGDTTRDTVVSVLSGQSVTLTRAELEGTGLTELTLTFNRNCDCTVRVTRSTAPPGGTPGLDAGFSAVSFLTLQVYDSDGNPIDGAISGGSVNFDVSQDDLPGNSQPRQILLLRNNNGWNPLNTQQTSTSTADPLTYQADLPGFSVFAIAVDTTAPTISGTEPTGTIEQVTPTLSASFSDNRGIDTDSFTLTIDGQAHDDSTGELTVTESGFTYVPVTALSTAVHDVEATVEDDSGLSTTETWSFTITTPECPTPPRIVSVDPADGATGIALDQAITVSVEEGSCAITETTLTVNGEEVQATYAAGTLTALLPPGISAGDTADVTVTVVDDSGNTAAKSWSYETSQTDTPDGEDPGDDGGISGWVWVVLILLVIAGIGGWYYWDQHQE